MPCTSEADIAVRTGVAAATAVGAIGVAELPPDAVPAGAGVVLVGAGVVPVDDGYAPGGYPDALPGGQYCPGAQLFIA
jgi:hypothetical protein